MSRSASEHFEPHSRFWRSDSVIAGMKLASAALSCLSVAPASRRLRSRRSLARFAVAAFDVALDRGRAALGGEAHQLVERLHLRVDVRRGLLRRRGPGLRRSARDLDRGRRVRGAAAGWARSRRSARRPRWSRPRRAGRRRRRSPPSAGRSARGSGAGAARAWPWAGFGRAVPCGPSAGKPWRVSATPGVGACAARARDGAGLTRAAVGLRLAGTRLVRVPVRARGGDLPQRGRGDVAGRCLVGGVRPMRVVRDGGGRRRRPPAAPSPAAAPRWARPAAGPAGRSAARPQRAAEPASAPRAAGRSARSAAVPPADRRPPSRAPPRRPATDRT